MKQDSKNTYDIGCLQLKAVGPDYCSDFDITLKCDEWRITLSDISESNLDEMITVLKKLKKAAKKHEAAKIGRY